MTSETTLAQTPLHQIHLEHGAKMAPFAGWSMPINYGSGIVAEHMATRTKATLFDVSHMAQVTIHGDDVCRAMEHLVPSDIIGLEQGQARYTLLTDSSGGIIDDLIVTRDKDSLFCVMNASRRDVDLAHLRSNLSECDVVEHTNMALIALQGPEAGSIIANMGADVDLSFMQSGFFELAGLQCRISRLGYTGEDGFEIAVAADGAASLAKQILADNRVIMAGLGARDTLRLEAGLCLYGNDIDLSTSPREAGLSWVLQRRRREQGGFLGDDAILPTFNRQPPRLLMGIVPQGRAPARRDVEVLSLQGEPIGRITSGGFGPSCDGPVSMGYIDAPYYNAGTDVLLRIRTRDVPAKIVKLPFVKHNYKRN